MIGIWDESDKNKFTGKSIVTAETHIEWQKGYEGIIIIITSSSNSLNQLQDNVN